MTSLLRDLRSIRNRQTGPGQQDYPLTPQMQALVDAPLQTGLTKVIGYAGAAKTSTLIARSRRLPSHLRMLYVAFTKSAQTDAAARFGAGNTLCRTANSLAFEAVGHRYEHKLRDLKILDVLLAADLEENWQLARLVLDTIRYWCTCADFEFPVQAQSLSGPVFGSTDYLAYAAGIAKRVWDRMADPNDAVPMSHEGYLKLFQLSRPRLHFDAVSLDEAQDTNPVTWDILNRQDLPLEIIGDPYQSIFLFRGAVNAMSMVKPQREFLLSQSFRFGPAVADIANSILLNFFGEARQVEGLGPETIVGPIDPSKPHAVISRTNAMVFHHAAAAVMAGKTLGFAGGIAAYKFDKLVDVMHLAMGSRAQVRDSYLRSFPSFSAFEDYAEHAQDLEAKRQIAIVGTYGSEIEELVGLISSRARKDLKKVDVTLSTAHRSKGLTMDYVKLADDFPDLLDGEGFIRDDVDLSPQEANLLYVAATRARLGLMLNDTTIAYLHAYPGSSPRRTGCEGGGQAPVHAEAAHPPRQESLF